MEPPWAQTEEKCTADILPRTLYEEAAGCPFLAAARHSHRHPGAGLPPPHPPPVPSSPLPPGSPASWWSRARCGAWSGCAPPARALGGRWVSAVAVGRSSRRGSVATRRQGPAPGPSGPQTGSWGSLRHGPVPWQPAGGCPRAGPAGRPRHLRPRRRAASSESSGAAPCSPRRSPARQAAAM